MKKQNTRRLLLLGAALLVAACLVVFSAAASVLAYRQFVDRDQIQASIDLRGLGLEPSERDGLQVDDAQQGESQGVLILRVEPGSPAEQAGLTSGAVILSVNGREVKSPQELKDAIAEYEVGDTVTLTIKDSEGSSNDVTVTLGDSGPYLGVNVGPIGGAFRFQGRGTGDMPHGFAVPGFPVDPGVSPDPNAPEGALPFDFDPFEGDHGRFFDMLGGSAFVMSVAEDGPAAGAGIQAGDAIVKANDRTIEDSQQLIDLVKEMSPGDQLTLEVQRGQETISVEVTLSNHPDDEGLAYLGVFLAPGIMPGDMEFFQEQQNS